jgi:phosphopantetheinyl transferase
VLGIADHPGSLRALASRLTAGDRIRARRFRRPDRRRAFLLGCALLRTLITQCTGAVPGRAELLLRPDRRPLHRPAGPHRLALSVSHAGGWVFAAACSGARTGLRLGIDIEDRRRPLPARIDRRLPWAGGDGADIRDWCLVEAALKADGRGLPALGRLQARGPHRGDLATTGDIAHRIRSRLLTGLPPDLVGAVALASPGTGS